MREVLGLYGYGVLEAAGGEQALALAARHEGAIDVLVTDVVMPELAGPDLAARLARERRNLRVLLISGYADGEPAVHGVRARYLQKPFSASALREAVRDLV